MWFEPKALLSPQAPVAVSANSAVLNQGCPQETAEPQKSHPLICEVDGLKTAEPQEPQASISASFLDPDTYCWPHSEAMNTQEISRFIQRVDNWAWKGVAQPEAEMLADELMRRDRNGDDRKLCVECRHLQGGAGPWRCGNAQASEVAVGAPNGELPKGLVRLLQRCPGFKAITL